ncbi:vegetative incompatibility protein HET-E-1 [Colletotrichum tamarilloi]|uniref:Vegetative incompatibility protein HET-E-1 n=1 Tax=Colletotrichum tamarilloi TaxID=1209934 RepID=A0ABQ9RKC1_9PEZI|nr:vegetative incompatibility protein HET-E-1 [Colletotrichum tamarilloi]KAK1506286.1 vegetative incompatibility protein HET-E-1 [Colletotrichum tamarilloi]
MADPLSTAGSVVGIISLGIQVVQSIYQYYSAAKDQHSDIARTLRKLEDLQSLLERLNTHLSDRKFRSSEAALLQNIESTIQHCEESIDELEQEARKFEKKPTDGARAAIKGVVRRLAYPFRESTLLKLHEDIDYLISQLSLALSLLQQQTIDLVQDEIENTNAILNLIRTSQVSSEIRTWLNAPDATFNFTEACSKKHPGTGAWFVNGPEFTRWLEGSNSFLWLKGFAGCGKTVLSSTVIQHTLRHRRSNPSIGLCFFFFSFNDESKQDASAMLRALILQLSDQLDYVPCALQRIHDLRKKHNIPPSTADLLQCFRQVLRLFQNVYVVLDALDESPRETSRFGLLETLKEIRDWSELGVHLLVTSRDEVDIREGIDIEDQATILMKHQGIDDDIASYVSQFLRQRLKRLNEHHSLIEKVLTEKAHGVSKQALDRRLQSLPPTLDETYKRMLENVPDKDYAKQMLTILCCASKPLTVQELINALAIEIGATSFLNPDRQLPDADSLLEICPGFTEVAIEPYTRLAVIRIAHFSMFGRVETVEKYPFAEYAAKEWVNHWRKGIGICAALYDNHSHCNLEVSHDSLALRLQDQMLLLFRDKKGAMKNWYKLWDLDSHGAGEGDEMPPPLYYASLVGALFLVENLLEDLERQPSAHGQTEVIKLLLERGAEVNAVWSALMAAGGEATSILLKAFDGTKVTTSPEMFELYMETAVEFGNIDAAQKYLDEWILCGRPGFSPGKSLKAASAGGHHSIVQQLLCSGAEMAGSARVRQILLLRDTIGPALQEASGHGHLEVVELLLEFGTDKGIPLCGIDLRYALQRAAAEGHEEIVQLLLNNGATPNSSDETHMPALYAASLLGSEEIVQLLLDAGADIHARFQGGMFESVLAAACNSGKIGVVEMLMARSASCLTGSVVATTIRADTEGSADDHWDLWDQILSHFIRTGVRKSLSLIRKGNSKKLETWLRTEISDFELKALDPLSAASFGGHVDIVRKFLKCLNEKSVENRVTRLRTALSAAAAGSHLEVVKLILDFARTIPLRELDLEKARYLASLMKKPYPVDGPHMMEDHGIVQVLQEKIESSLQDDILELTQLFEQDGDC